MAAPLAELIARRAPGRTLESAFYVDPAVHEAELALLWGRRWLFAGAAIEAAEPGAFFTVEIGRESALIVRGRDLALRAFFNVCRHRGSRICTEASGRVHRLVCPYHAWTYDLDGRLLQDLGEHGAEAGELGLKPIGLREIHGLVFVSLAADPPDFAPAASALAPALKPQGLARARIAHRAEYRVAADWKVIFENNRECFHCPGAHREYVRANYDVHVGDVARETEIATRTASEARRWAAMGLETPTLDSDMTGAWWRANRTPLVPGFVTESLDGKPVAPPMGDYREHDVGTLRVTLFPNFWMHGSGDHAVTTRLIPDGPGATRVRVDWLVRADAVEGRDYALDRLLPFWKLTSEQDWKICENVQKGIASRSYVPGPLSRVKEGNVARFVDWYVGEMRGDGA